MSSSTKLSFWILGIITLWSLSIYDYDVNGNPIGVLLFSGVGMTGSIVVLIGYYIRKWEEGNE